MTPSPDSDPTSRTDFVPRWTPWRFIRNFGVVSALVDIIYQGVRGATGPFLASLGASGAAVGAISGIGEALALAGRLGTGPLADRTRAYWRLAIIGYAMTILAAPLLGLAPALWIAAVLVIAERGGKAVRTPARDVMLAHATSQIGRGKGFAVHEALDQAGALAGPLLLAGVLAATDSYRLAFGVLFIPGLIALVMLLRIRRCVPQPEAYEPAATRSTDQEASQSAVHLGSVFWRYLAFAFASTMGVTTYAVIGFHLKDASVLSDSMIPVIYAGAMGLEGLAAVVVGFLFDRIGRVSLVVVPIAAMISPLFAFSSSLGVALAGIAIWSIIGGVQDSTMRATVASLVPRHRRGTAFGVFAATFGVATFLGSTIIGALYDRSFTALIAYVVVVEAVAFVLLLSTTSHTNPDK